jgi:phage/plasmid primase-like uncharacterized protein
MQKTNIWPCKQEQTCLLQSVDGELLTVGTLHWDGTKQLFKNYTVENCWMSNETEQKIIILTSNAHY